MELLGVLLGVRIAAFLHKELLIPITATYLWSDSTIVLHQVANDEAIKEVWTENRLKDNRRLREELKIQFRHVPTDDNPADIVSRGISAAELQSCEKWWHGAPFLALDASRWPEQPTTIRTRPSPSDEPIELYGTTAFTTLLLRLPARKPRSQWIRQRSLRKKRNPLDTITEPLLPTSATTLAVAEAMGSANSAAPPPKLPSDPILPREMEEKYDRWPRLVRIQYYVVRFAAACLRYLNFNLARRNKTRHHASALGFELGRCFTTLGRKPALRGLQLTTIIILRKTQLRHPPSPADRRNLGIFESQGLLYVKGRLGNMKLRPSALTPLFLPREARDTELIILEYHRINGHAGVSVTLANLRLRYWFTKGRSTIRSVLRKYCFACRRESMHHFAVPPWPQLPTSRVTNARPFFFTGLDFFGPVYLRAQNGSGGHYVSKYVCIFVCMTLSCIHLELCDDLSTDAFLHAFKRFGYRREFPHRILSDNGLSFVTAREVINRISGRHAHQQPVKRTLPVRKVVSARLAARRTPAPAALSATARTQQRRPANPAGRSQQRGPANSAAPSAVLAPRENRSPPPDAALTRDEEKLVDFCQRHNIEWQTITELSPWKGGVYERLIGLIKHCLRRSIGNTKPTVVEFLSLLLCAEHTANSRPLSYVADSDTDFFLVRPVDFLIPMLHQEPHQYPLDPATDDNTPDDPDFIGPGENKLHAKLMKDLSKGRQLADAFWKSFRDGVLLELRNRGIDSKRRQFGEASIQPGDLVLVSETDVPRSEWRLALVTDLLPHSDGLIRSARIRYASTKRETNRALEHLYPIGQIPQSTAACSLVPTLGIFMTVLISDAAIMSSTSTTTTGTSSPSAAFAPTSSVPISSAGFDDAGNLQLADLPPIAAPKPTPDTTASANSAARSVPGLDEPSKDEAPDQSAAPNDPTPACELMQQLEAADERVATISALLEQLGQNEARDASGTANSAARESPEPIIITSNLKSLPALSTPRSPLFDPLTVKMEHLRQQMVANQEKLRRGDGLLAQLQQCFDRMLAGLPADRNLARIHAASKRLIVPPPAATRADSPADQGSQTEDAARIDRSTQTQDPQSETEADDDDWQDTAITGAHLEDNNPFLKETQPFANEKFPSSRSPPPTTSTGTIHLGARHAAEARQAARPDGTTNGTVSANSAAPMPAVAHGSAEHSSAFNSRALLRANPVLTNLPNFPDMADMERRARQFFAPLPPGPPPVLEPIDEDSLRSIPAAVPQPLSFGVDRTSPAAVPTTWDPLVRCNGDGEQDCFHRCLRRLRIIQTTRWITGTLKKDEQLKAAMHDLLERFVPSFGHMILLSYAVRLFNRLSDARVTVDFLTRLLDLSDFDEDIPKLLVAFHPRLTNGNTTDPWPNVDDLRTAAKRWICYCQRAYKEVFDRLSGPIIWSPEWMQSKTLPSEARQAFDRMATNAAIALDVVRQMVYRYYVLRPIEAVRNNEAFESLPIDHVTDRDLINFQEVLSLGETICFVDEYTMHYFGATMDPKIHLYTIPSTSFDDVFKDVVQKYPSRSFRRVIFWFGTAYMVDQDNNDYGTLVAFLSHHYAANLGFLEQIVIAPPYAHSHRASWTYNVLGLLVQKDVLLPHARLIIHPHDLQMWRHDYFPTTTAENTAGWPSQHLTENGQLRTPHVAEVRKFHLKKYHKLDLWSYYKAKDRTAPMPKSILDRTTTGNADDGDFTEPGIVRVSANSAAPATSSTSATIAEQNPRAQDREAATDAAAPSESPATSDAVTSALSDAPATAAPAANHSDPATIADVETRLAPLAADVAQIKDALLKIAASLPGPSAPKTPDTTTEPDA